MLAGNTTTGTKSISPLQHVSLLLSCCGHRGTGASVSPVSRVSQAPREKMALWGPQEKLDPKDLMELQDLKDKTDHQDPKVAHLRSDEPVLVSQGS